MAIEDRDYARRSPNSGAGPLSLLTFNSWLIIVNSAVFLLEALVLPKRVSLSPGSLLVPTDILYDLGYLSRYQLMDQWQVWRVLTFQFLHANIWHVAFNMFGLWVFGGIVERHLGFKRYAAFYLVCGIAGGVTYLLLSLLGYIAMQMGLPKMPALLFDSEHTPLIGASAGVFGVIMACAYIMPDAEVQLIFPPVTLRMKLMAYGYVAIAAINLFTHGQNAGGDAAHIGGAVAGYFFIRRPHLLRDFFDVFGNSNLPPRKPAGAHSRASKGPDRVEVDRILSKVQNEGLASLTEKERRTLREATEAQRGGV